MNPNFAQIAELFSYPSEVGEEGNTVTANRRVGRTSEESEQFGRVSLSDGDFQSAIDHFKKAVELHTGDKDALLTELAGSYDAADQVPQAFRQFEYARRARETNPEPLIGLSDLFRRHGRYRDAIERLQKAIEIEPDNSYHWMKLAEAFREMGEPKRAIIAAQAAVEAKPDQAFYHYWLGDVLLQTGQYAEALLSLRAAIELSPGDDFLYTRVAVAFWRLERRTEAIKAIRLASDLDVEKHVYHGLLEAMLEEAGLNEEAELESERSDRMDRYDMDQVSRLLREMGIAEA